MKPHPPNPTPTPFRPNWTLALGWDMFIARRLTDEIREDPQKPCTKKWDQPSEGGRHFEPLILELNLTRFSTFVPGPPGHPK